MAVIELKERVERGADAVPCACGGYCEKVECTDEERNKYGCGRDMPGWDCCAVAFVCRICGTRYVGKYEAPEME